MQGEWAGKERQLVLLLSALICAIALPIMIFAYQNVVHVFVIMQAAAALVEGILILPRLGLKYSQALLHSLTANVIVAGLLILRSMPA